MSTPQLSVSATRRTACFFTQERKVLFRRATRRDEKPCFASFFPSMPTER